MLQQSQLGLATVQNASAPGRGVQLVNSYLSIPAFTATYPVWSGASYIVARIPVLVGKSFALRLPIEIPSDTFVACVKWNDAGSVAQRRNLWNNASANVDFPIYSGEVVLDSCTAIEIWNVSTAASALLSEEWKLPLTELCVPSNANDLLGTAYPTGTICFTHPVVGSDIDDLVAQCACYG